MKQRRLRRLSRFDATSRPVVATLQGALVEQEAAGVGGRGVTSAAVFSISSPNTVCKVKTRETEESARTGEGGGVQVHQCLHAGRQRGAATVIGRDALVSAGRLTQEG